MAKRTRKPKAPPQAVPKAAPKPTHYRARLVGVLSYNALELPEAGTSFVIGREPRVILEAQRQALLSAIEAGNLPGVKPEHLDFEPC